MNNTLKHDIVKFSMATVAYRYPFLSSVGWVACCLATQLSTSFDMLG